MSTLKRELELEGIVKALEAALLEKGSTDEEILSIKQNAVALKRQEEEKEDPNGGKPLYRSRAFIEGSMQSKLDIDKLLENVGAFQRRYFSLPNVEVRYLNLDFCAKVDLSEPVIKNVANSNPLGAILFKIRAKMKASQEHRPLVVEQKILDGVTGILKPKSLTLVIGAPGCGKSSFLKMCCGLLEKKTKTTMLTYEKCSFNGVDLYDGKKAFIPSKLCCYIDQIDNHIPSLTVQDTFQFAFDTLSAGEAIGATEKNHDIFKHEAPVAAATESGRKTGVSHTGMKAMMELVPHKAKREEVHLIGGEEGEEDDVETLIQNAGPVKINSLMRHLGIDHVADTIVGNAAIRGVSGGQRRRVSVGEMLCGKSRLICGDEISTGLDSQTTYDITRTFQSIAKNLDLTIVLSMLQPPPETFALFDQVIVLHQGSVAYHGPTDQILEHFENNCGLRPPPRKDVADFLVEITSSEELARKYKIHDDVVTKKFSQAFIEKSEAHAAFVQELATDSNVQTDWGNYYTQEFTKPLSYYIKICMRRKMIELRYNPTELKTRYLQTAITAIFTGTCFYQVAYDEFTSKMGLIFTATLFMALSAMPTIPGLVEARSVFYKQRDQSFFPTTAYAVTNILFNVVIIVSEALMYGNLVFWPAGLASNTFGIFILMMILISFAMSQWFAFIAAIAPNAQAAQPMAGMSILLFTLFSGFIVQRKNIPPGWKWLYWLSPISLAWRANVINEFRNGDRYKKCTYQKDVYMCPPEIDDGCCVENDDGIVFLKIYAVQIEPYYILVAIVTLSAYSIIALALQIRCLTKIRHIGHGSALKAIDETAEQDAKERISEIERQKSANTEMKHNESSDIPYERTTLAFLDLHYSVQVPSKIPNGPAESLELLGGVTGFAKPASMTALMGSSGAGKTTLLDVIANRKTSGKITGEITLNGIASDAKTFSRISAYCEQLDVHNPGPTVEEAVDFSASLRLPPAHNTPQRRKLFVKNILQLLELEPIASNQTGTIDTGGLSFEQRKRLTMAVELAANPSILFLDEPTSGLDSRAALVVIRATQNIAATGRSVVCTIHQPSYALFSVFDQLLLLKRGGRTVYFGELGHECSTLVPYFENMALELGTREIEPLPDGANPATWMLSLCVTSDCDFATGYHNSDLAQRNLELTQEAMKVPENYKPPKFTSDYATPFRTQFVILLKRQYLNYWRGPAYNVARGMVSIIVALIFGSCYGQDRPEAVKLYSRVLGRVGLFFLDTFFLGIIYFSAALTQMSVERESFYRERAARMYSPIPYSISFGLSELPYLLSFSFIHTGILFAVVDLYPSAERYFFYFAFFFLYVSFTTFFAQSLVVILPNQGTAQTIGTAFLQLTSIVGGFSITPNNIADAWIFMYWLSPIHYALEGLVVTQFHGADQIVRDFFPPMTVGRLMSSHDPDSHFGGEFTWSHRFQNIIILFIFCSVFRTATLYGLTFIDYTSR